MLTHFFDKPQPIRWVRVVTVIVVQTLALACAYTLGWTGALDHLERRMQVTGLTI